VPALEAYLDRPPTPADPGALEAVERGPMDPGVAQPADDMDLLLDRGRVVLRSRSWSSAKAGPSRRETGRRGLARRS